MNNMQNDSASKSKKNIVNVNMDNNEKNIEQQKDSIDMSINDEILPEEKFNIQIHEDEKPSGKINVLQQLLPDNIYINNLNINYMGVPLKQNINEPEKKEKKNFDNLSISSSISTFTINSSYENINEITSHKYINNNELRMETRHFLLEKCNTNNIEKSGQIYKNKNFDNKYLNIRNYSKDATKKLGIYNSSVRNNNNIKRLNSRNFIDNQIIRKTCTNQFNNKLSYETLNNFQNLLNKSEQKINTKKVAKAISSNSLVSLRLLGPKIDKSFDSVNDFEISDIKRKTKLNNNKFRKKQQLKELDIISSNIEKSSQNLNQPDLFYAGLFNDLMIKDYPQLKDNNIFHTKANNYYSENNDEIKEAAKESDIQDN